MIEYPSEEWIERLGRVFGRFRNKSVVLRGDGTSISRNYHEVALAHIHLMTKKYYRENKIGSFYNQEKHLTDQARTLWLLAYNFEVDRDKVLGVSAYYDFIARPFRGTGTYDIGIADLIYISPNGEIPLILDFQYYNNVVVEQYNSVHFIQGLNFYVKFYLQTRFPVIQKDKVEVLEQWISTKLLQFTDEEQRQFHWYHEEYKYPECYQETDNSSNHIEAGVDEQFESISEPVESSRENDVVRKKWKYLCSESVLLQYFDLLKQPNPNNGKPLLTEAAIEWIVGYYFGSDDFTLKNKPKITANLTRKDIMFFIYQFSTIVSPGMNRDGGVRLTDTVFILKECFPSLFKGKPKSIADQISRVSQNNDSAVKSLLELNSHKDLLHSIDNSLRGV